MNFLKALLVTTGMILLAVIGSGFPVIRAFISVVAPYAAMALFLAGVTSRVFRWAGAPVPFRIPTTCGQQSSLPWIKAARLESPHQPIGVVLRVALEVLLFRSLFRNVRVDLRQGAKLAYGEEKLLWFGALAFHWSLLVIVLRHLRFFMEPVPRLVAALERADGFLQVGVPAWYLTELVIFASLAYLLLRRLHDARLRYMSLVADYLMLSLLLGIVTTGILMRHFWKTDILAIKEFTLGLVVFSPRVPEGAGAVFYAHILLVSGLLACLPFSKLMHMAGIFLSPTRNLPNNSRMKRHVNPWDHPVRLHSYEEWEDEFRDRIKAAGLPLERP